MLEAGGASGTFQVRVLSRAASAPALPPWPVSFTSGDGGGGLTAGPGAPGGAAAPPATFHSGAWQALVHLNKVCGQPAPPRICCCLTPRDVPSAWGGVPAHAWGQPPPRRGNLLVVQRCLGTALGLPPHLAPRPCLPQGPCFCELGPGTAHLHGQEGRGCRRHINAGREERQARGRPWVWSLGEDGTLPGASLAARPTTPQISTSCPPRNTLHHCPRVAGPPGDARPSTDHSHDGSHCAQKPTDPTCPHSTETTRTKV